MFSPVDYTITFFPGLLEKSATKMNERAGQIPQIPQLKDAVTALANEMKANTKTLQLLHDVLLFQTAGNAAMSQTVLKELPLKNSHDVTRYLGQPI